MLADASQDAGVSLPPRRAMRRWWSRATVDGPGVRNAHHAGGPPSAVVADWAGSLVVRFACALAHQVPWFGCVRPDKQSLVGPVHAGNRDTCARDWGADQRQRQWLTEGSVVNINVRLEESVLFDTHRLSLTAIEEIVR